MTQLQLPLPQPLATQLPLLLLLPQVSLTTAHCECEYSDQLCYIGQGCNPGLTCFLSNASCIHLAHSRNDALQVAVKGTVTIMAEPQQHPLLQQVKLHNATSSEGSACSHT